jgi:hypothetical protein
MGVVQMRILPNKTRAATTINTACLRMPSFRNNSAAPPINAKTARSAIDVMIDIFTRPNLHRVACASAYNPCSDSGVEKMCFALFKSQKLSKFFSAKKRRFCAFFRQLTASPPQKMHRPLRIHFTCRTAIHIGAFAAPRGLPITVRQPC